MEPRRELTGVDLRALVTELGDLDQPSVRKAYLYDDGLVRLRLRDPEHGRRELLFETGSRKRITVADPAHVADAPDRPPNFAKMMRNRLQGARLVSLAQHEFDRIVVASFEREDDATAIVAELFGDGNVAVLDGEGVVVDCLREVRLKSRRVVPGEPYEYPASRVDPFALDRASFAEHMAGSTSDIVRTLATQLNLGGTWAEELCTRAGVPKELDIDAVTDEHVDQLLSTIGELDDRLAAGDLDPGIYEQDGRPVDVAPVPLEERAGLDRRPMEKFNAAVDTYFYELSTEPDAEESGEAEHADLEAEIAEYERIIDHQQQAIEGFEEEAARTREQAETLYGAYELADEVISAVRGALEDGYEWDEIADLVAEADPDEVPAAEAIADVDPSEGRVSLSVDGYRIPIDPLEGVEKNADRLYQEAKRIEEKRDGALTAIAETEAELQAARERLERAADDGSDAEPDERTEVDWLERSSIPIREPEDWYERFRWFRTSDGFLVIGGRTAEQNEELVEKYLETGDAFVHAQAHGGPATIVKATGPSEPARDVTFPDRTLEEAARFAVSYSSVWKAGQFSGDAYAVDPEQVTKTPESGEYLETGAFAIRGDRRYFENVPVGLAIGVTCEPATRVIGGPPAPIEEQAVCAFRLEPGRLAPPDAAKRLYRRFREAFEDTSFVRQVANTDRIQRFLPAGGSRIRDD